MAQQVVLDQGPKLMSTNTQDQVVGAKIEQQLQFADDWMASFPKRTWSWLRGFPIDILGHPLLATAIERLPIGTLLDDELRSCITIEVRQQIERAYGRSEDATNQLPDDEGDCFGEPDADLSDLPMSPAPVPGSPVGPRTIPAQPTSQNPGKRRGYYVVLDGPPGPESGRFVEVEDETGASVDTSWVLSGGYRGSGPGAWWEIGPFVRLPKMASDEYAELVVDVADGLEYLFGAVGNDLRQRQADHLVSRVLRRLSR